MSDPIQLPPYFDSYPFRVLVVDDEPAHRTLQKAILVPPKYEVAEAGNGRIALERLENESFDVVLLDKLMPGMDGDEVCRRIRGELNEPMLPIIMVTGCGTGTDLSASLSAGADDFVRKPYNSAELIARVDSAVHRKRLTDQLDSAESMLFALARMVEAKDTHTGDHCSRLACNAVLFGQALGLAPEELLALRRAGVLHDIGKLGIPDSILLKPTELTPDEWRVMNQHPAIGAKLCSGLRSMKFTLPIIRSHHERWDGSGYPDGLKGDEIPYLARVFQLVDIHDALFHARSYKPALSRGEIIDILEREARRGWRDPDLTAAFLDILRTRPEELEAVRPSRDDLGFSIYQDVCQNGGRPTFVPDYR